MSYILASILAGIIAGLISSILLNWILYNYMSPKIKFTKNIYKSQDYPEPSGFSYKIGIRNIRKRDAVNLKIRCTICIPDFPMKGIKQIDYIRLSTENIMEIPPKINRNVRLLFNCDELIENILNRNYSIKLVESTKEKKVLPEYFFERFGDAYIRFSIYLSDGYSGFSRLYRSKRYNKNDISEKAYGEFV